MFDLKIWINQLFTQFSLNRIVTEADIECALRLRQLICSLKSLDVGVLKLQQQFFKVYAVEIGEVVSKPDAMYTFYSDVLPIAGFVLEMVQWLM